MLHDENKNASTISFRNKYEKEYYGMVTFFYISLIFFDIEEALYFLTVQFAKNKLCFQLHKKGFKKNRYRQLLQYIHGFYIENEL